MDKGKILQQAFEIKKRTIFPTFEEKGITDIADQLIVEINGVVRSLESKVDKLSNRILRDVDDCMSPTSSGHFHSFTKNCFA